MKFQFIKKHRSSFPVQKMCSLLTISRSGFNVWVKHKTSKRAFETQKLENMIRDIFHKFKGIYGSPRITSELHDLGCKVSENRVAKVMRDIGFSARVYSNQKWRAITSALTLTLFLRSY